MNELNVYSDYPISCIFRTTAGDDANPMHIHPWYEIFLALSENISFRVNSRTFRLSPGCAVLLTDKDLHQAIVPSASVYRRCIITFSPSLFRSKFADSEAMLACFSSFREPLVLTPQALDRFLSLARELEGGICRLGVEQWLNLGQLLVLLCDAGHQSPEAFQPSETVQPVRQVLDYIHHHYAEEITLDQLGKVCFLNKSYLCRLFKRHTGFRIHEYLLYCRLSHAQMMLLEGSNVTDTARRCGFHSDTFFITSFKNRIGITPHQYVRLSRRGNAPPIPDALSGEKRRS